jgi:MoaA/NifB/PqqE/SkfB family radical SAM enzyme
MELTPFTPLKLLRHAPKVEAMLRGEVVYPVSVEIDLSNVCPHDCPFCSFGTSTSQGYRQQNWVTFPPARMLTLLDEMAECGVKSLTFTGGGEPLVHRQAAAIFEKASEHFEWGLVTNGLLLKGAVADVIARHAKFVRVSLDAGTEETHAYTHGLPEGQFQYHQILDNIRALREKSDAVNRDERLVIGASFCVMDQNWRELYQGAKNVKDHGGDYLEVRPTYPTDWRGDGWGKALAPERFESVHVELTHARMHLDDATFRIVGMTDRFSNVAQDKPVKNYQKCRIGDLTTVIGADGRGWHCCVNRGIDYFTYGSFLNGSFREIWDAQARQTMIDGIDISKCPRCRYDPLNETIEHGFIQDKMHANFV